jgi:hypothetical protein
VESDGVSNTFKPLFEGLSDSDAELSEDHVLPATAIPPPPVPTIPLQLPALQVPPPPAPPVTMPAMQDMALDTTGMPPLAPDRWGYVDDGEEYNAGILEMPRSVGFTPERVKSKRPRNPYA